MLKSIAIGIRQRRFARMYQHGVKQTLKAGSAVFGASAIFLLIAPNLFLELLDLESNDQMVWSMRMIGIVLFALAGNMWQNSKISNNAAALKYVGIVMVLAASALGFLTIFIPATLNPFTIGYAAIGFSFALFYLINLLKKP
jgi:predicted membrane channel-forming protein YqfA (hemolysin III family)